jgi:phytoene synthase
MSHETALAACEAIVRRADPDRYLSALFAPAERRPFLYALYAFNHELARIGETLREPMMADIRLEWWREAVLGAREGRPRAHDVVRGLAELFARTGAPFDVFDAAIAARRFDAGTESFADLAALEAYADATSGNLMRLAWHILGERAPDDALCRHAGTAYALCGLLRALPFHAARGKFYLPGSSAVTPADIRDGAVVPALASVSAPLLQSALAHHAAARRLARPGRALPALLPAALAPLYVNEIARHSQTVLVVDVPVYRRQWAMLRAALRGHV